MEAFPGFREQARVDGTDRIARAATGFAVLWYPLDGGRFATRI